MSGPGLFGNDFWGGMWRAFTGDGGEHLNPIENEFASPYGQSIIGNNGEVIPFNPLSPEVQAAVDAYYADMSNPMRQAYSPSSYRYTDSEGNDNVQAARDATRAGLARDAQNSQQAAMLEGVMRLLGLSGSSGGGSGSAAAAAAAIQQAVDKINQDYERQVAAIAAQRGMGEQGINSAYTNFQSQTGQNNQQYGAAADSLSRAIADRLAQAQSAQSAQAADAAKMASTFGLNGGAIAANAQNNANAANNISRAQQDLADNYRQVQLRSQGQMANAGSLMNQGALGSLANNFANANNAALASRDNAIYQAQHPTVSGGGGGGGGSASSSLKDLSTAYDLWGKLNGSSSIDPTTALLYAQFKADPNGFAANPDYSQYLPQMGAISAQQLSRQLG